MLAEQLATVFYLSFSPTFAGIALMVVIKAKWLPRLRTPVHEGLFGRNKTWLGVLVMPIAAAAGAVLASCVEPWLDNLLLVRIGLARAVPVGLAIGLAYVLFELPNSYVKRRLGIAPGMLPDRRRWLFMIGDQTDSVFGVCLVYALWLGLPWITVVLLLLVGPTIHIGTNLALYVLGLRKRPC